MRQIPAEKLENLARFDPPEYETSEADSAKGFHQFQAAMEDYRKRDYARAIPRLSAAAQSQPQSVEARYYLAICLLLTNDRPDGIQLLKDVTASGNTPYLESARFYLAKALLGEGNLAGADLQLRIIVEMHGKLEKQAQLLHAQIALKP